MRSCLFACKLESLEYLSAVPNDFTGGGKAARSDLVRGVHSCLPLKFAEFEKVSISVRSCIFASLVVADSAVTNTLNVYVFHLVLTLERERC